MAVPHRDLPIPDRVVPRRALLSVTDKTGLAGFAQRLAALGVELVSTGGTAKALAEAGLAVRDVSDLTGFPEIMDGRVKTLHPAVHGGLLAIRNAQDHVAAMEAHGIGAIDLLVVNLYAFDAVRRSGAAPAAIVENIDIGGPAMLRAGAKNHAHVAVVTDPADYDGLAGEMEAQDGATSLATRRRLAARAFAHTAAYDAGVAGWMADHAGEPEPRQFTVGGTVAQTMRYGENPHQNAFAVRTGEDRTGVLSARSVQGKALSFNNLNDADAALEAVAEIAGDGQAACVIVKHANPCGAAMGATLAQAHAKALACDPVSAFGGIVATSVPLDEAAARAITAVFTEVVIAPDADDAALAVFAGKPSLRLLLTGGLPDPSAPGRDVRSIAGGLLVQDRDAGRVDAQGLRVVTKRAPSDREMADLLFAFRIAKHVKSNAIVYARDGATVGVGAGQMSRVDSARIAARKALDAAGDAQPATVGSVVASDAFFPFADGLLQAAEAGATAVIQPGGSKRDDEVIAAADEAGLAMVFTGQRHFRH